MNQMDKIIQMLRKIDELVVPAYDFLSYTITDSCLMLLLQKRVYRCHSGRSPGK